MTDIVPSSFWIYFNLSILALLGLDLFFVNRQNKAVSVKSTIGWVLFWIVLALLFGVWIYNNIGSNAATEYVTAYLIEWTLSVDNLFVFIIVFKYFKVPDEFQHRVLFWGILGALVLRGIFISAGVTLIHHFEWLVYLFGAFLVFTGFKIFFHHEDEEADLSKNFVVRIMHKFVPMSDEYDGSNFFTRKNTNIIYCSNVLAVLGLHSLYFGISHLMKIFKYLKYGIAIILIFVGAKMIAAEFFHIPSLFALGMIITILFASVMFSLRANSNES